MRTDSTTPHRIERLLTSIWYERNPLGWPLWPVSLVYRCAVELRRAAYRSGLARVVYVPVPVVVVGNITAGGTGKTPLIVWLARRLQDRGHRVGIVSRGYRGRAQSWPQRVGADSDPRLVGDEPVLLAQRTRCPVVVGPDRVAAAERLLAEHAVDVLLSDDGLQHYRLGRRIEIAVVDGVRGLGNGRCLPAGPLREPARRLETVDAIVVNGGTWTRVGALRAKPAVVGVCRIGASARALAREHADEAPVALEAFKGRSVHAVAGIAHPERFFALLEIAGLRVRRHPLGDHAEIHPDQLTFDEPGPVLVTEKDAVKCRDVAHEDLWCVMVELALVPDDEERLLQLVTTMLSGPERTTTRATG